LYVNGQLQGSAAYTAAWNAAGALHLGRDIVSGAAADFLTGDVDEVQVYQRVLFDPEIADLYNQAASATGYWKLDETSGTNAADASGQAHPGTLAGDAVFTPPGGHSGGAVVLGGAGGNGYATFTGSGVRTDRSFTVTAWVNLADMSADRTVLSQTGSTGTGFALRYFADTGQWCFAMSGSDALRPGQGACSSAPARPGVWTHLAAVFDQFSHHLLLYVNGQRVATGTQDRPWNASGGLQLGRVLDASVYGEYLRGTVDEIRTYAGVLTAVAISTMATQ
jgi:hypothetical protein